MTETTIKCQEAVAEAGDDEVCGAAGRTEQSRDAVSDRQMQGRSMERERTGNWVHGY